MSEQSLEPKPGRGVRLWRHVKRNFLGYTALVVAVSMTPLPAYAAGKIGTKQIKNGAITTPKLATSAVTGAKIANGSIGAADLGSGAAYRTLVFKRTIESGVTTGNYSTANVMCPTGYVAIGGGASTNVIVDKGTLQMSVPVKKGAIFTVPTTDGEVPDGWRTDLRVDNGPQDVWHYAICASK